MAASASIRSRPVGDVAVAAESDDELVADPEQDVGALRVHGRLVEPAEPDAAGQVADHRVARLGDATEPFEQLRGRGPRARPVGGGLVAPAARARRTRARPRASSAAGPGRCGRRPPPARGCGRGPPRRSGASTRTQPVAELLGQPTALDVEALQEGVEVLARAVHPQLGVPVLVDRPVAAQLGEVGEGRRAGRARRPGPTRPRRAPRRGRRGSPTGRRPGPRAVRRSRARPRSGRPGPARRAPPGRCRSSAAGRSRSGPTSRGGLLGTVPDRLQLDQGAARSRPGCR